MWSSLGVQDTVCYLHKPTLSHFQSFIAWEDFNKNHVLDTLQSGYPTYQISEELTQQFLRHTAPNTA